MKIISLGEILWDVFSDAEYLGGAPLNFSAHAHALGHQACFVSAVGNDPRGDAALDRVRALGLDTRFLQRTSQAPTGTAPVTLDSDGQPHFTITRPAAYDFVSLSADDVRALSAPPAAWIYFGTLQQTSQPARTALAQIIDANPGARRFYDVNLRPDCYNRALVDSLLQRASIVKLNEDEAEVLQRLWDEPPAAIEDFARKWKARYGWEGVCITRGAEGCALLLGKDYIEAPGFHVQVADAVGSGDAFSAAFVHGMSSGWTPREIGEFANRVGALVASRRGAIPSWSVEEAMAL